MVKGNPTMTSFISEQGSEPEPGRPRVLGVASHIYVISLPQRQDRRAHMERIRTALNLSWTIIDATPFTNPLIHRLLDWVVHQRGQTPLLGGDNSSMGTDTITSTNFAFRWPRDIDALSVLIHEPLLPSGSDLWTNEPPPSLIKPSSPDSPPSLMNAVDDYAMPTGVLSEVHWMKLTSRQVACWHSHASAIRTFVDRADARPEDVAVFLEDDVDMEKDIAHRLSELWTVLPAGWDIVLLGHCWSDEAFYPPLSPNMTLGTHLHPAYSPYCTHAYALSLSGARRLLQHLRYPPFAYSRALDRAFSWLIETGRLRAYSVVPSVVVQTKDTPSDVLPGCGSEQTQWLVNGVLGS